MLQELCWKLHPCSKFFFFFFRRNRFSSTFVPIYSLSYPPPLPSCPIPCSYLLSSHFLTGFWVYNLWVFFNARRVTKRNWKRFRFDKHLLITNLNIFLYDLLQQRKIFLFLSSCSLIKPAARYARSRIIVAMHRYDAAIFSNLCSANLCILLLLWFHDLFFSIQFFASIRVYS